jgi:transglutaminase-like putative cysteine protease
MGKNIAWILIAACAVTGCANDDDGGGGSGASSIPSRTYTFTYEATIPAPPAGTQELAIWVPVPMEDKGVQEVTSFVFDAPVAMRRTKEDKYGNEMLYGVVPNPTGPTKVSWTATVVRYEDRGQGTLPDNPWFLRANNLIPIDGPAKTLASKLGVDRAEMPASERTRRIYDDVLTEMAYDKNHEGWGLGSFEHATTVCKGNCTDFHARFIGTARAVGVKSRFTMGIPMKPGDGTYNSCHCWAHWRDGDQWRPVDISEADKVAGTDPAKADWFYGTLDHDRISISIGRDITLSPPQKGETLNYFVFPYAEADGRKVVLDESMWNFTWKDVRGS